MSPERHSLSALGCTSDAHALLVLPRGYIDTRFFHQTLNEAPIGRRVLFSAKLDSWELLDKDGNSCRTLYPAQIKISITFADQFKCKIRAFGEIQEWIQILIRKPQEIHFIATVEDHPRFGLGLTQVGIGVRTGTVQAFYAGRSGAPGTLIQETIGGLRQLDCSVQTEKLLMEQRGVPEALKKHGYSCVKQFLTELHFPCDPDTGYKALAAARAAAIAEVHGLLPVPEGRDPLGYDLDKELIKAVNDQREKLSEDQRHALNRIRLEMKAGKGARLLLNGDVGTGKTLVFILAAAAVARASNLAVAIMAPNELVSRQIHAQALHRFPDLDPCLVVASEKTVAPSKMYVGTHALLSRALPPLSMVVIDEQHKFSVAQRTALTSDDTHVIEASATPIPRSLAMALFGGWASVPIMNPPVQKKINSHWLDQDSRGHISKIVRSHLSAGRKVMFLYPSVKGNGLLSAAERMETQFPGQVTVLHGKADDKIGALESFRSGKTPIAMVSTVVEVGVDVPDVGCMVVSGADRFGIAQLHQLRGRLMRAGGEGDFVLYTDKKIANNTKRRLEALCSISDGFRLAEADLQIRGFGELLGECQAGGFTQLFKLTDLRPEDFLVQETIV